MPERHSACRHSRGVRIAVRSLESRFLQSRHNLSWSMSRCAPRSPTPYGTPLELALEVLPLQINICFDGKRFVKDADTRVYRAHGLGRTRRESADCNSRERLFVFTRLLLHASSWLRGADDSS